MAYAANIFAQGMDAFDKSYDRTQTMRQDRARTQAGQSLASGDRQGAAQAFGQAGMTDDVRQMQADRQAVDNTSYSRQRDQHADDLATQQHRAEALKSAATGLKGVQPGHRAQILQQIAGSPLFQQAGIDPGMFQGLTEDQLTDEALDAFTGTIDEHLQGVNLGGGGYGSYDKRSGKLDVLREPDKLQVIPNGGLAIGPNGEQIRNPKTFAPQRPRAASSGGALPGLPPGYRPK
jgi:hypothetical protein